MTTQVTQEHERLLQKIHSPVTSPPLDEADYKQGLSILLGTRPKNPLEFTGLRDLLMTCEKYYNHQGYIDEQIVLMWIETRG